MKFRDRAEAGQRLAAVFRRFAVGHPFWFQSVGQFHEDFR